MQKQLGVLGVAALSLALGSAAWANQGKGKGQDHGKGEDNGGGKASCMKLAVEKMQHGHDHCQTMDGNDRSACLEHVQNQFEQDREHCTRP